MRKKGIGTKPTTMHVGLIDYLNTMPFHFDLAERLQDADVQFRRGVPSELNHALAVGEVDIAPISAIEAARLGDDVIILPDLGIASLGAVRTVLLFSWASDIRELHRQPVALTDHSATSVALLEVLCRERYHIEPDFHVTKQHLPSMLADHQAALVIGDDALVESTYHRALSHPHGWDMPYIYDLGDEWLKMTGLPFVFATWAARRDRIDELEHAGVLDALYASTEAGLREANRDGLARAYSARLGLPAGVCIRYLRDLRLRLGEDDRAGLKQFLSLALDPFDWDRLHFWQPRPAAAVAPMSLHHPTEYDR